MDPTGLIEECPGVSIALGEVGEYQPAGAALLGNSGRLRGRHVAALARLGEHKGALDGGWDQLDATWVFPGVETKVASSSLSDQTGPAAKRDDVRLRQDVEAVLGLLRGLFATPFTSFCFPDPGPDFDARLGKLVDELSAMSPEFEALWRDNEVVGHGEGALLGCAEGEKSLALSARTRTAGTDAVAKSSGTAPTLGVSCGRRSLAVSPAREGDGRMCAMWSCGRASSPSIDRKQAASHARHLDNGERASASP